MSTVLVASGRDRHETSSSSNTSREDDKFEKNGNVTVNVDDDVSSLGAPKEEKRFWFQRTKNYDANAIATQVRYVASSPLTSTDCMYRSACSITRKQRKTISREPTGEQTAHLHSK